MTTNNNDNKYSMYVYTFLHAKAVLAEVHIAPGVPHILVKDLQTFVRLGDVGFSVRVPSWESRRVVQR